MIGPRPFPILVASVAIAVAFLSTPSSSQASAIVVNTTTDELVTNGNCSLREAIRATNMDNVVDACPAGDGADTITLPAGTYPLSIPGASEDTSATGDLDITDDLTINGAGSGTTIIDAGALDRVLHVPAPGINVNVSQVTIRNGNIEGSGGGIFNVGSLTLADATVGGNQAGGDPFFVATAGGGGIFNNGSLTLERVTVTANALSGGLTEGDRGGGGIDNVGSASINDSMISENIAGEDDIPGGFAADGGGIRNRGTLTVSDSTITDNRAHWGGGIRNESNITITGSSITANAAAAGGGIDNTEFATLADVTVDGNAAQQDGGGIGNARRDSGDPLGGATMTLVGVTVSNNTAQAGGGGIAVGRGSLSLTNSTVSANTGGGIIVGEFSSLTMLASTITGNVAGQGISLFNALVTIGNTIVANNLNGDCQGTISSTGYNLIKNPAGCTISGDPTGNIVDADPLLGPLADNGGPTQTHALLAGSPATDAGSPACPPPATDQRGVERPQDGDSDGDATCDMGAFELEGVTPPTATHTPSATPSPTPTTPPGCFGDLNGDGAVTGADVAIVARNLSGQDPLADLDGDGHVSRADLKLVLDALRARDC